MDANQRMINKLKTNISEIDTLKKLNRSSSDFDKWKRSVQQTLDKIYGEGKNFASQFKMLRFSSMSIHASDERTPYLDGLEKSRNILELAVEECKEEFETEFNEKPTLLDAKINKIFISHSSKDKNYVDLFTNLLIDIGLDRNGKTIFYSSSDGFGIPLGENIYDYLKDELNQNILVIFILSDNYYSSAACLNEMGAAWVTSKAHYSVLLPEFDFSKINGAIDPLEISFKMDDKAKLNEFKIKVNDIFNLENLNETIWEVKRDTFIDELNKVIQNNKFANRSTKVDIDKVNERKGNLEIYLRFINNSNQIKECHDLIIELTDNNGEILQIEVEHDFLDKFLIYQNENRREKYECRVEFGNFNPRRIKTINTNSEWGNA